MINTMIIRILDFNKLINDYVENKDYKTIERLKKIYSLYCDKTFREKMINTGIEKLSYENFSIRDDDVIDEDDQIALLLLASEKLENRHFNIIKMLENDSHPNWESIDESLDYLFYEYEKRFINRN